MKSLKNKMKALIFDLDDTLVVEMASAKTAFLETCELAKTKYGINPLDLHNTLSKTCREFWRKSPAYEYCLKIGVSSWEGLWARFSGDDNNLKTLGKWSASYRQKSWYHSLLKHDIDDMEFALILADTFIDKRRELQVVFDDTVPMLSELKPRFKLGLLSNGVPDLQRYKINRSGIGEYFDEIIISGEIGTGKPNHRIFEIILDRLNVLPEESVMVGNSLRSDIGGAKAVGMTTVWLNREKKPDDNSIVPDFEVAGLREIVKIF